MVIDVDTQHRPDVRNYLASNRKAKRILDFVPEFSPAASIQEILKHVKKENIDISEKRFYNIQTFKELENES